LRWPKQAGSDQNRGDAGRLSKTAEALGFDVHALAMNAMLVAASA
jgi:hypothetical protein